jgi:hypothetical protein
MPDLFTRINQIKTAAARDRQPPPQTIQQTRALRPPAGGEIFIAKVVSDATGGGYYNCHLQSLDATDWDTTTADQLDDTGGNVIVLNLVEIGSNVHNLVVGRLILCWKMKDDEGNDRYVGIEAHGRHSFGEW